MLPSAVTFSVVDVDVVIVVKVLVVEDAVVVVVSVAVVVVLVVAVFVVAVVVVTVVDVSVVVVMVVDVSVVVVSVSVLVVDVRVVVDTVVVEIVSVNVVVVAVTDVAVIVVLVADVGTRTAWRRETQMSRRTIAVLAGFQILLLWPTQLLSRRRLSSGQRSKTATRAAFRLLRAATRMGQRRKVSTPSPMLSAAKALLPSPASGFNTAPAQIAIHPGSTKQPAVCRKLLAAIAQTRRSSKVARSAVGRCTQRTTQTPSRAGNQTVALTARQPSTTQPQPPSAKPRARGCAMCTSFTTTWCKARAVGLTNRSYGRTSPALMATLPAGGLCAAKSRTMSQMPA